MRLRTGTITTVLAAALALAACGRSTDEAPSQEITGSAMGTSYSVKMVAPPANLNADTVQQDVATTLATIEKAMSTYIADSELSQFNAHRSSGWYKVSVELCQVIAEALSISAASGGAFDITVGPLVNLWGFGPEGTVTEPPGADLIALRLQSVGYTALHTDCAVPAIRKDLPDLYVDLSAFAKGYGVDRVAAVLDAYGIDRYLVEIGGELRMRGLNAKEQNWAIAVESPDRSSRNVQSIMRLTDKGVATSGDYRNYFEHAGKVYSHTIDPRTGYPVTHSGAAVTVVAETAALADALATALLVLGPEEGFALAEQEDVAALFLVRDDGSVEELASRKFADEVVLQ